MASPQLENGYLRIAHELQVAIMQSKFTALERQVLDAIMLLTYFQGLKKAEMTLEDIRLMVGDDKVMPNRYQKAFNHLVSSQVVKLDQHANGKQFVGLDKDYEKWSLTDDDATSAGIHKATDSLNQHMSDKMSAAESLLVEIQKKYKVQYALKPRGMELGMAKALLEDAADVAKSPRAGLEAIRDFFSQLYCGPWNKGWRPKLPFSYAMQGSFVGWYKNLPEKTPDILLDEKVTKYHYWYNPWTDDWEMNRDRPLGGTDG